MTYYKLIEVDLRWAEKALSGTDEFDLNVSAYHCQQAVEKICGYIAQRIGIKPIRSHNLVAWIEFLEKHGVEIPEEISNRAEEIASWEASSRYNINFVVATKTLSAVIESARLWLSKAEALSVRKVLKITQLPPLREYNISEFETDENIRVGIRKMLDDGHSIIDIAQFLNKPTAWCQQLIGHSHGANK